MKNHLFAISFLTLFTIYSHQEPIVMSSSRFPIINADKHTYNSKNIIKFYKDDPLFADSSIIYFESIDTSIVSYYDRGFKLNKSKPKELKIYEDIIDWFDLEKDDQYKYATPELFFANEFNKNFINGFKESNDRFLRVMILDRSDLDPYQIEVIKKELPTNPKKIIELRQPVNLSEFCKAFVIKHPGADFLIINSGLDITLGTFDGYNPPIPPKSKKRACAIRIPRTIIDLNTAKIQAYFLDEDNLFYDSPFVPIKDGIIDEFENIGESFDSIF